jgi:hypothetical protein
MAASIDRRWAAWSAAAIVAAAVGGCARPVASAEVNGTVTLDGNPLAGVSVAFLPQAEGVDPGLIGRGTTDSSGRYTLAGPEGLAGAVVGTNRVILRLPKTRRSSSDPSPPPPELDRPIPARYLLPKSSPLVVEVRAGGPQTINLALTSN